MIASSSNALDEHEDWVVVNKKDDCKGFLFYSFWQGYKKNGKTVVKYYEKAKVLYNVYRVVRMIVNLYILYHTLHPLIVF